MKRLKRFGSIMLSSLISQGVFAASNIDTTDKYAWNTNSGWVNFNSTHSGVTVYDDHLEGYAWAENIGWVRLGTYTGGGNHTYTNTSADYGINNEGSGNLSGYAWSSHVGWINFNPSNSQVTINTVTGDFDGYAWSENVGWVHFQKTGSPAYKVRYNVSSIPPNAPTNLSGSAASQTQINLSWTDNSTNETGFKVERDGVLITTTVADAINYSDSGLSCGTTYSYSIKATNVSGDSSATTINASTSVCATVVSTSVSSSVGCATGDSIINSSCNAGEQTFTEEAKVGDNASVARVTFDSDVENKGMISNSTIRPGATLTGGKLTGTITNEGTIADINFVGMTLSGGTLSGTITNNSKVGGIIKDVQLAAGAILKGGKVGGEITGDPDDLPLITATRIMPGSALYHVRISPTVELPKNVVLD